MYAGELLNMLPVKRVIGEVPAHVTEIVIDSRAVQQDSMFICIKGYTVDGHDYAEQAIEAGATIIVTERELTLPKGVTQVVVRDTTRALGLQIGRAHV